VQPDGGLHVFWVYCDMTSFGGGWTMCYSTNNLVSPQTEVKYDENLPYGTNGYRADCNNIEVIKLFVHIVSNSWLETVISTTAIKPFPNCR